MSLTCFALAGVGWYALGRLGDLNRVALGDALAPAPAGAVETGNYLIVGSDTRKGAKKGDADFGAMGSVDGERSDTIMVLRFDQAAGRAQLLSLPRDLYVPIAGTKHRDRINSAFAKGADVLVRTVEQDFGISISHYVEIDFQGFKHLVDAVGGVTICFDAPSRDPNTGLNAGAGCQKLNGTMALAYARSRHFQQLVKGHWREDPSGDLGRIQRQQNFLRVAMQKAAATRNPITLNKLLNVAVDNITIDDKLTDDQLFAFANKLRELGPDRLDTFTVPATGKTVGDKAVLIMDVAQATPILARFRS